MPHSTPQNTSARVAIIGGGPAGLMAAEVIASAGHQVSLYDAMPSVGRKFLLAGVGGMNITHSEPHSQLLTRYGSATPHLKNYLDEFGTQQLCDWIHGLGVQTFVGSSGRVFPADMKAAPLLRAWLHRLRELGVEFQVRHRWLGWQGEKLLLEDENSRQKLVEYDAVVLALGGASWPRLGSDGKWVECLRAKKIQVAELLPSNCGFEIKWSDYFQQSHAGAPLQTVMLGARDSLGRLHQVRGEAMIVATGIEGTGIYALSSLLRDLVDQQGYADLMIDLLPDISMEKTVALLARPKGKNSVSNFLRKQLSLPPVKLALLRELTDANIWQHPQMLAQKIKQLTVRLENYRPVAEAISSAGGIYFDELDEDLMLRNFPGIFCAGEMLDWEAPTGGYLLTACFATGRAAGKGVVNYLATVNREGAK